jgi:hypothetical protein
MPCFFVYIDVNLTPAKWITMIELKLKTKEIAAIAFVLFAVLLSSFNSVSAAAMYWDMSAPEQMLQHDHSSHGAMCQVSLGSDHCGAAMDMDTSDYDHSQCSDLHCGGFSFPVSDSVYHSLIDTSEPVKADSQFYTSALLPSPYMPPIGAL